MQPAAGIGHREAVKIEQLSEQTAEIVPFEEDISGIVLLDQTAREEARKPEEKAAHYS